MRHELRQLDLPSTTDEEARPVVDLINSLNVEAEPRQTPFTLDEARMFFTSPGVVRTRKMLVDDAGHIAAHMMYAYPDDGTNPDKLRVQIGVSTQHRRMGLGSRLLGDIVKAARDLGRSKLSGTIFDTVPAAASFADALGVERALEQHVNVVKVANLDVDLLRSWMNDGPRRGPGYSTTVYAGMVPDDLMEGLAHLYYILERDSPMPEGHEPRQWTAELVEQMYTHFLQGVDSLTAVVTHDETGKPVGISQLIRRHGNPATWVVTVTMVDYEHRGHALGKWVKAAVNLEAIEMWHGGEWQETANAFTNDAMLGINHAMGFEHELTATEVELPVSDAEAYLASRA